MPESEIKSKDDGADAASAATVSAAANTNTQPQPSPSLISMKSIGPIFLTTFYLGLLDGILFALFYFAQMAIDSSHDAMMARWLLSGMLLAVQLAVALGMTVEPPRNWPRYDNSVIQFLRNAIAVAHTALAALVLGVVPFIVAALAAVKGMKRLDEVYGGLWR